MARDRTLIALALLAACGKSEPKSDPPKTTDDAAECAAKVKELAPWLEKLEIEQASHEIDFGYTLQVIDRAPVPLPRKIDVMIVQEKKLDGYDLRGTEHERLDFGGDLPAPEVVEATLAAMFATKPDPTDKSLPPPDLLRIDVAPLAHWSDVVHVVDAAAKAGYARVLFAFTATSKLEPPLGVASKITDADEISRAGKRMEEMRDTQCTPWDRAVMRHEWNPDRAANARAIAKETADAIAACNCAADPNEVRVLKWIDSHWHQATIRTSVIVSLVGTSAVEVTNGDWTAWAKAHENLLVAVPEGTQPIVHLVAK